MAAPAFIQTPGGDVLSTAQILRVRRDGVSVNFYLASGRQVVADRYPSAGAAAAALAGYLTLLEITQGAPTISAITPSSVARDAYLLNTVFIIEGTNFRSDGYVSFATITATFVASTGIIWTNWNGAGIDPGVYSLAYADPQGNTATLPDALTVT